MVVEIDDRASVLVALLEDTLVSHGRSGSGGWEASLRSAAAEIARARAQLEDSAALLEAIDVAAAALAAARADERLPEDLAGPLDEAIEFVRDLRALALDAVVATPITVHRAAHETTTKLRASEGTPALHRGLAIPSADVLPGDASSDASSLASSELAALGTGSALVRGIAFEDDDDDAFVAPAEVGAALRRPEATGEALQIRRIARDCMEDLSVLSGLRRSRDEDPWGEAERFELRLLASLDALVSLELPRKDGAAKLDVASELWGFATEWAVPDLGRAFAFAFVLSCLDERSATRWVLLAMRRAPTATHPAFEDALALGSSPAIDSALIDCLQDETRPGVLLLALRVLARRRFADAIPIMPLLAHPDPRVARAAVHALSSAPREEIEPTLVTLLDAAADVAVAAAVVLATLGSAPGLRHLRAAVAQGAAEGAEAAPGAVEAAAAVAAMGDARDAEELAAVAAKRPELLPSLGIHGYASHLPTLLARLTKDSTGATARDVARAIHRITGLRPPGWSPNDRSDYGVVPWRDLLETAPTWPTHRLRRGEPHPTGAAAATPIANELLEERTLQGDRRRLAVELGFATKTPSVVDLDGWAAAQRSRIAMAVGGKR